MFFCNTIPVKNTANILRRKNMEEKNKMSKMSIACYIDFNYFCSN